jgi:hypothetical protein
MSNPHQQYPPQQPWGPPPQQPRRRSTGKIVGLGCLGIIGLFVVIAIIAAAVGGGSSNKSSKDSSPSVQATTSAPKTHKPAKQPAAEASKSSKPTTHKPAAKPKPKPDVVTFKVWGTAPAGALGPLDITYGSDSDNRKGTFSNGAFTATLPLNDDAMYYDVTAQLQGSGDIQCSVTVGGKTKKGHASGSYNICDAQLSSGLFGGWE